MENKDNFLYEVSNESQEPLNTCIGQQWIYSNDNNNNNYSSNQISLDLTSFYNANSLIDWRTAYIQIPLVSVVDIVGAGANEFNPNIYSLKNGYANLINSMQVECSNTTVNQVSNNINFYTNFKVFTSKSKDWFNTAGPSLGFYGLDDHNTWSFGNVYNNRGYGSCNNTANISQGTPIDSGNTNGNLSLFNRVRSIINPSTIGDTAGNGTTSLISLGSLNQMGGDYIDDNAAHTKRIYYHNAIIRLGDIADFFDKLNLSRCYVRLLINLNVGTWDMDTLTAGVLTSSSNINSTFSYNTCPFNINAKDSSNLLAAVTRIRATIGVCKAAGIDGTVINHTLTATRVYASQMTLAPEKEKLYRMNNAQKLLVWDDVFSTSLLNQPGNNNAVNYVVSNGISRLKGILTVPFISGTSNAGSLVIAGGSNKIAPNLTPFGSEPSTTSPLMSLYNFNIFCAGKALMPSNLNYNFNTFNDQFIGVNSINGGGMVSGDLCSGSIDYNKWFNNYRYYYLEASRHDEADISPKSISVQFTNNNLVNCDYYFFIIFERHALLDVVSGQLQMI